MSSQCLHRWKPWEALNDFSRKLLGRGVVCFLTVPLHISRKNLFKFCVRKWNRITALPLSWRRSQQHSFPAAMLECCKVIPFFLSFSPSISGSWAQKQHLKCVEGKTSIWSLLKIGPMFCLGDLQEDFVFCIRKSISLYPKPSDKLFSKLRSFPLSSDDKALDYCKTHDREAEQ